LDPIIQHSQQQLERSASVLVQISCVLIVDYEMISTDNTVEERYRPLSLLNSEFQHHALKDLSRILFTTNQNDGQTCSQTPISFLFFLAHPSRF
jgi:hypothetical protein